MPLIAVDGVVFDYTDEEFADTCEPVSLEDRQAQMLIALADRRWRAEIGGTMVGPTPIDTSRDSQTKITAAYLEASQDEEFTISNWKVAPGLFAALDAATIIAIGNAVTAHVQACFDNEAEISSLILLAEDDDDLDAIDIESGWPE